jgi:5-methylcytosine-specific restriction enzyme A
MPLRICVCGKLSPTAVCAECGDAKRRASNARPRPHRDRRPDYDSTEVRRRAATVQAWRAEHGDLCPGWQRAPHMVDPAANPLTADHTQAVGAGGAERGPLAVLCRSCNSSKGDRA